MVDQKCCKVFRCFWWPQTFKIFCWKFGTSQLTQHFSNNGKCLTFALFEDIWLLLSHFKNDFTLFLTSWCFYYIKLFKTMIILFKNVSAFTAMNSCYCFDFTPLLTRQVISSFFDRPIVNNIQRYERQKEQCDRIRSKIFGMLDANIESVLFTSFWLVD